MSTAIIQLGRLGDILNVLPLAHRLNAQGNRSTIFAHRDFMDLAQSVSYADFHSPFCHDYRMRTKAVREAQDMGFDRILEPQLIDGRDLDHPLLTDSFCKHAYVKCGVAFMPDPIVIDRRHPEDEAELARESCLEPHVGKTPIVLCNSLAISNPPNHRVAQGLFEELQRQLGHKALFADLRHFRAKRFTDLLGLYDRAKCLVTVDTATLHLAGAHTIPYVALLADKPTPWFGSYCRGNVIHKARYGEAVTDPDFVNKIVRAVESTL